MEAIETKRLFIRELEEYDAERWSAYREKREVALYQSWNRFSLRTAQKRIRYCRNHPFDGRIGHNTHLAITLKDDTMIGDLYLEATSRQTIGIGYTLDSIYWHHGYAREAVRAILVYMRDEWGYAKSMAYIYEDNVKSRELLLDLGFHQFTASRYYHDQGYVVNLNELILDEESV